MCTTLSSTRFKHDVETWVTIYRIARTGAQDRVRNFERGLGSVGIVYSNLSIGLHFLKKNVFHLHLELEMRNQILKPENSRPN